MPFSAISIEGWNRLAKGSLPNRLWAASAPFMKPPTRAVRPLGGPLPRNASSLPNRIPPGMDAPSVSPFTVFHSAFMVWVLPVLASK